MFSVINFLKNRNKIKQTSTIILETDDNKYLLGLRKDTNKWSFIGGGVDNNEIYEDTIKREVFEEVGLVLEDEDFELLETVEVEPYKEHKYKKVIVAIFYSKLPFSSDEVLDIVSKNYDPDQEFSEFNTFTLKELNEIELHIPKEDNEIMKILNRDEIQSDTATDPNLLFQIKNENNAVKKLKLIQSFNKLGAVAKLKIIKEFNSLSKEPQNNSNDDDLVREALSILSKNQDLTLEDLEWFSDERIDRLEEIGAKEVNDKLDKLLKLFNILNDSIQDSVKRELMINNDSFGDIGYIETDSAKLNTLQKAFEDLFLDKGANNKHLQNRRDKALQLIKEMIRNDVEIRKIIEDLIENIDSETDRDSITKSLFEV